MAKICAASTYPGGDPTCVLAGPAPTVQCLEDNPGAAGAALEIGQTQHGPGSTIIGRGRH